MTYLWWVNVCVILIIAQWLNVGQGYPQFRDRIPNGRNVTNPCNTSTIWRGVGHQNEAGGGDRNPFGLHFKANGYTYNSTLCMMDSDGDGKTNGEELGDPDCIWTQDTLPSRTTGITHPGICDPLNSPKCRQSNQSQWLSCAQFTCPAFNKPDTKRFDLMFPRSEVPAQETTYLCMGFKLPSDRRYHSIGTKPIIDNIKFPHHMLLYGCTTTLSDAILQTPEVCQMAVSGCMNLMGAWTVGVDGVCYPDDVAIAFGQESTEYVVLQMHWNNPQLIAGEFDASGMALYYTDQPRQNEALIIKVGQLYLNIPPGQQNVEQVGKCTSKCSNSLVDRKLKIIGAVLHMHLLGRSGEAVLTHDGVEQILISEPNYDYNTPRVIFFNQYYDFDSGDEIKLTCRFDSTSRNTTTYWGEGTSDEMCYLFLLVIPAIDEFLQCSQYKASDYCSLSDNVTYAGCDVEGFKQSLGGIGQTCTMDCSPQCMQFLQIMKDTKCFDIEIGGLIRTFWPINNPRLAPLLQVADYCMAKAATMTTAKDSGSGCSSSLKNPV